MKSKNSKYFYHGEMPGDPGSEENDSSPEERSPLGEPFANEQSSSTSISPKEPELQQPPTPHKGKKPRWFARVGMVLGISLIILVAVTFGFWMTVRDVSWLEKEKPKETAMMAFRDQQREEKHLQAKRIWRWAPLSRISPYLINAVLISEDDKFYQHEGFDWEAIKEAYEKNKERGRFAFGGSTITQQLAKNLFLKPTKNPLRKIREAVIAYEMEKKLSKRRILELYLNVIEWGDGIYGAQAAAQVYFGKPAADLTPAEAIRLAVILPSPRRYSPLVDTRPWMNSRRRTLAERMLKRGILDDAAFQQALVDLHL
jgi:monofunctional biosynthetic peptidoglycan transglycosylase